MGHNYSMKTKKNQFNARQAQNIDVPRGRTPQNSSDADGAAAEADLIFISSNPLKQVMGLDEIQEANNVESVT